MMIIMVWAEDCQIRSRQMAGGDGEVDVQKLGQNKIFN